MCHFSLMANQMTKTQLLRSSLSAFGTSCALQTNNLLSSMVHFWFCCSIFRPMLLEFCAGWCSDSQINLPPLGKRKLTMNFDLNVAPARSSDVAELHNFRSKRCFNILLQFFELRLEHWYLSIILATLNLLKPLFYLLNLFCGKKKRVKSLDDKAFGCSMFSILLPPPPSSLHLTLLSCQNGIVWELLSSFLQTHPDDINVGFPTSQIKENDIMFFKPHL